MILSFLVLCMWGFWLPVCMCTTYLLCLQTPEEGVELTGARVGRMSPCLGSENWTKVTGALHFRIVFPVFYNFTIEKFAYAFFMMSFHFVFLNPKAYILAMSPVENRYQVLLKLVSSSKRKLKVINKTIIWVASTSWEPKYDKHILCLVSSSHNACWNILSIVLYN